MGKFIYQPKTAAIVGLAAAAATILAVPVIAEGGIAYWVKAQQLKHYKNLISKIDT